MATPGTWPSPSNCTSRIVNMAWANVATNSPIASWLGRSCRNVCTIRGENWPIANCTTTIVIVNTSVANDTIDTAIVSRIAIAASGPPVSHRGTASKSNQRSIAIVPIDTTTPASTHITGMNHKLERTLADDALLMHAALTRRLTDAPWRVAIVVTMAPGPSPCAARILWLTSTHRLGVHNRVGGSWRRVAVSHDHVT